MIDILGGALRIILIYGITQAVLRAVIHYKKGNHMDDKSCVMYKRGFMYVFLGIGIFFLILFGIIFMIPNNMNDNNRPLIMYFIFIILSLCFIPAFIHGRWFFKIEDGILSFRDYFGKKKKFPVSELSGYQIGLEDELCIYHHNKKVFSLDMLEDISGVMNIFQKYKVPYIKGEKTENFVIQAGISYVAGLAAIPGLYLLFIFPLLVMVHNMKAILIMLLPAAILGLIIYWIADEKIYVRKDCIERKGLGRPYIKINFSDIDCVTRIPDKVSYFLCIYANGYQQLKITEMYKNANCLRRLAQEKGWMEN